MYVDLEVIMKNFVCSEITRKSDILLSLANIYQQVDAEKTAAKFGLQQADGEELTAEQIEEREKQ